MMDIGYFIIIDFMMDMGYFGIDYYYSLSFIN